jgi:hypothetical protein
VQAPVAAGDHEPAVAAGGKRAVELLRRGGRDDLDRPDLGEDGAGGLDLLLLGAARVGAREQQVTVGGTRDVG